MSTFESDDLETTGYFLPEGSQLRLKQLREYVEFLANLARPRRPDEAKECFAEIRPGEVAICRDTEKLHDIIGDIYDEQRLEPLHRPQARVREEQASYLALPAHVLMGSASSVMRQLPTCH